MNYSLTLLALQALPRLKSDFLSFESLYCCQQEEFQKTLLLAEKVVAEEGFSWLDIYRNSDIGRERLQIAERLGLKKDTRILEVGCGRGYFTVAAASFSCVIALDKMEFRKGWWELFSSTMETFGFEDEVVPLQGDCTLLPFRNESFDAILFVHSTRNFLQVGEIESSLHEARRVLKKDGMCAVVENVPQAKNERQKNYIELYRLSREHLFCEVGLLKKDFILRLFKNASFEIAEEEMWDSCLQATPPLFSLEDAKKKGADGIHIEKIVKSIKRYGVSDPPLFILIGKIK